MFEIPEILRAHWWQFCAHDFLSDTASTLNFENFLKKFIVYADQNIVKISEDHSFDVLVRSPNQTVCNELDKNTCAIINIGDEQTAISIAGTASILKSGQGCWIKNPLPVYVINTITKSDLDVLFYVKYKSGYSALREGILLNLSLSDINFSKVAMSSGVHSATRFSTADAPYFSDAYIPCGPWRNPNQSDIDKLSSINKKTNLFNTVKVFSVPVEILKPFKLLDLRAVSNESDYYTRMRSVAGKQAVNNAIDYVRTLAMTDDTIETMAIYNRPGLYSSARDNIQEYYLGLHIDRMLCETITDDSDNFNLLSINLGSGDRYFFYINITLQNLINLTESTENISYRGLVRRFFQLYPNYPVIRLTISPGDAYIAPAKSMIHDGIGPKTEHDLHLMFRGYFNV